MTSRLITFSASLSLAILSLAMVPVSHAQTTGRAVTTQSKTPRVNTPTAPRSPFNAIRYPWKKNITATVFWIGERPTPRNPTPNHASSWDTQWQRNYGGYDNPDKAARYQYRPKGFVPGLNPFYVALPYNDVINHRKSKPEASRIIPWWNRRADKRPGKTCCKGRWVQIVHGRKVCYAQWEDCGPFTTDDWQYVFGNKRPKNTKNKGAGIDVSPAIRDYLGMKSNGIVHWRFIDFSRVPRGPWSYYGKNNPFVHPQLDPDLKARQEYMTYLRKLRDEAYRKKNNRQ